MQKSLELQGEIKGYSEEFRDLRAETSHNTTDNSRCSVVAAISVRLARSTGIPDVAGLSCSRKKNALTVYVIEKSGKILYNRRSYLCPDSGINDLLYHRATSSPLRTAARVKRDASWQERTNGVITN